MLFGYVVDVELCILMYDLLLYVVEIWCDEVELLYVGVFE